MKCFLQAVELKKARGEMMCGDDEGVKVVPVENYGVSASLALHGQGWLGGVTWGGGVESWDEGVLTRMNYALVLLHGTKRWTPITALWFTCIYLPHSPSHAHSSSGGLQEFRFLHKHNPCHHLLSQDKSTLNVHTHLLLFWQLLDLRWTGSW